MRSGAARRKSDALISGGAWSPGASGPHDTPSRSTELPVVSGDAIVVSTGALGALGRQTPVQKHEFWGQPGTWPCVWAGAW